MSDLGSDISDRDDTPSISDKIDQLEHFNLSLYRKIKTLEERQLIQAHHSFQNDIFKENIKKYNSLLTLCIIYLFILTFILVLLKICNV